MIYYTLYVLNSVYYPAGYRPFLELALDVSNFGAQLYNIPRFQVADSSFEENSLTVKSQ